MKLYRPITFLIFLSPLIICFFIIKCSDRKTIKTMAKVASFETVQTEDLNKQDKQISTDKNVVFVEKFYNKKGGLIRSISKQTQIGTNENRVSTNHLFINKVATLTSEKSSTTTIGSMSNYLIGFSASPRILPNLSVNNVDIELGYRLIGNFYVKAETNYNFSDTRIGFTVLF